MCEWVISNYIHNMYINIELTFFYECINNFIQRTQLVYTIFRQIENLYSKFGCRSIIKTILTIINQS